jgi:hypothetical protein
MRIVETHLNILSCRLNRRTQQHACVGRRGPCRPTALRYELKNMLTRLFYIECPVCKKRVEQYKFLPGPKKIKWDLIQREIQCPLCKAELIMEKDSQKKLKLMVNIALLCLPFFIVMLADQLKLISIFTAFLFKFGIVFSVAMMGYLFYTVVTIRYVAKK